MHAAPRMNALIASLSTILPLAGIGGAVYMQQQNIPIAQGVGILLAFLMESALFLATGSGAARTRLAALPPARLATVLTLVTPLTWLLAGGGELWQMVATTAITAFFAFWYLRFPESDAPVLLFYGALAIGKAAAVLYLMPWPKAPTAIIGEFAWLRTLLFAVLLFRRPALTNYGFLPSKEEWRQGVKWFLLLIPAALAIGIPIGFVKVRALPDDAVRLALAVIGTFLGHYIFVALREEVLFRAMLLPNLQKSLGAMAGLLASCVIFGAVHLPNWRFALVATVAGWFYARSYQATGSIRSAMITHALTNVVARVFLTT
ncbi:MAG: lysostaphin resistance A-like protein [Bryobacteraceae bacterium]